MIRFPSHTLAASMSAIALVLAAPALAEDFVIENVTLVDGTGQPKQANMSIGVEEGRITFVTPTAAAPQVSGRRLDGAGRYLMPGLMDVHIHLEEIGRASCMDRVFEYV